MRLIVVTHSYGRNGAAVILKTAMAHWARELGWQVDAVVDPQAAGQEAECLDALGVRAVGTAIPGGKYDLALVNTAVHLSSLEGLARLMPTALWVHEGVTLLNNLRSTPGELSRTLALPRRLIFQTRWQSECVFRSFIHALPQERIAIVPCGVESAGAQARTRAQAGAPTRIVCIGSVYQRKRQMDLAAAVVSIARHSPIRCTFIGDLERADSFGDAGKPFLLGHPDLLHWTGGIDDRGALASACGEADIACFPSGDETFGMAPLEAGLWGLPVVLADLPAYREVGWRAGHNCLMHPVGDVGALQTCIETLIASPALGARIARGANALARQYPVDRFLASITQAVQDLP